MASEPVTVPIEYHAREGFLDEVFAGPGGVPAPHAAQLVAALQQMGPEHLASAGRRRDATFMQQGITFELTGEDGPKDRPFPLDLVPRIIPADEWIPIKRGLAQRIRALNAFVDDVYHAREIVRAGVVPWRLVVSRSHFARVVHGIRPPGGVYTHVAGCDLVRDADGTWRVLEDNVRTPLGHLLRAGEPGGDDAPGARALRPVPRAPGRPLPPAPAGRAARRGAQRRRRGHRCRVDAGPVQLRLLRARLPRAPDGRRAGRGLRPRGARRRPLHAHDRRPGARARGLPAHRRRLRRSTRVPRRTRCSACRGWCAPTARGRSRWPTPSARAWPTTRRSTTTCPT